MIRTFRMKADHISAGFREIRHDTVDRPHHQMHVDRDIRMRTQCLTDHGADCQVRDVMVVHHVEVDPVRSSGDYITDLFAENGEVGGQNTGGQAKLRHDVGRLRAENAFYSVTTLLTADRMAYVPSSSLQRAFRAFAKGLAASRVLLRAPAASSRMRHLTFTQIRATRAGPLSLRGRGSNPRSTFLNWKSDEPV